ncbi:MAG: energy transducer TonB [Planctomycetota bacterium]
MSTLPLEQDAGLEADRKADFSFNQPPDYPAEAVRQRMQGVVLLELKIGKDGDVLRVDLLESSGHEILDTAAIKAVLKWRGTPAKSWGRAVESTEILPIRFRL